MANSLPIEALRPAFSERLEHTHLVISAATGSGKSTHLPIWAKDRGAVLIIEPRRVACTALARFLAASDGTPVGEQIGYSIRFDHRCQDQTPVIFVTPGVALRWLATNGLDRFNTVIIDEFHERRWDTDLLLALLHQRNRHRLVVTSATLDAHRLADYLNGECLEAEGRQFPVDTIHRGDDPSALPEARGLEKRVSQAVEYALQQGDGDVLVFLPGRGEIASCQRALQSLTVPVLTLHAGTPAADQARVLSPASHQRVILATNVAETSLTLPGVTAVVDSGLERRTSQRNGRTVLSLARISKRSAQQRAGRAGRTGPGICLRLWGRHAPLSDSTPPELQREELTEPMLAAASAGERLEGLRFPDPLPEKSLAIARERLEAMEAIEDNGAITDHGRAVFSLPIDSFYAHLITAMPDGPTREAMADLSAALSTRPRFLQLPDGEQARQTLSRWSAMPCDATTLVLGLREPSPEEIPIHHGARREARQLADQIRRALDLPALECSSPMPERARWLWAAFKAAPETAYVRRQKRRHALGNGDSELVPDERSRFPDDAEAALVFDEHHRPGRQGKQQTFTTGTCLASIPLDWLTHSPRVETTLDSPTLDQERPVVTRHWRYAGRIIDADTLTPEGAELCQIAAQLILDGRLLSPAGPRLAEDMDQWWLYQALAGQQAETPEPVDWLSERLAQLGVETAEDLALIDPEDLHFAGIPEWERDRFDRQYPPRISLGDLRLAVYYQPSIRRITLERIGGERRSQPKRWELPAWSGWKVRYRENSRVVDVK